MPIQKIKTGVVEDNAITTSKVLDGSVTPEKLATSGTLPALDGSQLINIQAGSTEITDSTDDPAVDTNPADGVGALWANTTTGCLFCCTDATTDLNVWTRITVCTNDIAPVTGDAWIFGGSTSVSGATETGTNELTYLSLSSDSQQNVGSGDANGNTPQASVACSSATTSYIMGVHTGAAILDSTVKFTFANATNSASPTSVTSTGQGSGGAFISSNQNSMSSATHGYVGGGRNNVGIALQNAPIRRINFSNETVNGQIANINTTVFEVTATQNSLGGYFLGGRFTNGNNDGQFRVSTIDKFTFASETSQTSFDDLSTAIGQGVGAGTETHGYVYGGRDGNAQTTSNFLTNIFKLAFASNSVSEENFGDLTGPCTSASGAQSTTHAFVIGGTGLNNDGNALIDTITHYAFASSNSAVISTSMTRNRIGCCSHIPTITF